MRLATRDEVYKIDSLAAKNYGLAVSELVEKAGAALIQTFEVLFQEQHWSKDSRIGIWCGSGNNGADGRVMARGLHKKGYRVEVLEGTSWNPHNFEILIDALFGVGLNRPLSEPLRAHIAKVNASRRVVVAVDIPSGLDADTGQIHGACVKARWTFTISPAKPGLFLNQGPYQCGRIQSVDIGFPVKLLQDEARSVFLIGAKGAKKLLPSRGLTSNKTSFGHLLVLAGAPGMEGAALLAAEAAVRMGCGYVTLCSPAQKSLKRGRPDFLTLSLEAFFKSDLRKYTAVVVGPGLGVNEQTQKILRNLLAKQAKVLVDADALTVLAQTRMAPLPENWLLTPHAGELSRLLNIPAKDLEGNRLQSVQKAQNRFRSVVLFKGFRTVVGGAGKCYIIGSGNVALAKAGSGDVLSGFIGSLMAQGLSTDRAAVLGAFLHGRIADDWLRRGHTNRTLMASDLPELIDASLRSL